MEKKGIFSRQRRKELISPYCVVHTMLKNLWFILLCAGLFFMLAYLGFSFLITPKYSSTANLAVTLKDGSNSSSLLTYATTSSAEQLAELLDSSSLKRHAAEDMGMTSLPATVTAEVPEESNIIILTVTADTPRNAYLSAVSLLNHFDDYTEYILSSVIIEVSSVPTIPRITTVWQARKTLIIFISLLGAAAAVIFLYLFFLLSGTIQTPEGVKLQADTNLIATIPHENKKKTFKSLFKRKIKKSVLISSPTTGFIYVEAIHKIRVQLEHRKQKDGSKVFLISSVGENEGKSTIAANVVLALAKKNKKVLLIDGDLRKPAMHLVFEEKLQPNQNLSFLLKKDTFSAEALLDSLVYRKKENLFCLYSVPDKNSAELLTSSKMKQLVSRLRNHFDYILIDSPPISYFRDTEMMTELCDQAILVVRQNVVTDIMVNDAIDMLNASDCNLMGIVLNDMRELSVANLFPFIGRKAGYGYGYGGYGYGYGYNHYGKHKYGYGYGYYGQNASLKEETEEQNDGTDK